MRQHLQQDQHQYQHHRRTCRDCRKADGVLRTAIWYPLSVATHPFQGRHGTLGDGRRLPDGPQCQATWCSLIANCFHPFTFAGLCREPEIKPSVRLSPLPLGPQSQDRVILIKFSLIHEQGYIIMAHSHHILTHDSCSPAVCKRTPRLRHAFTLTPRFPCSTKEIQLR